MQEEKQNSGISFDRIVTVFSLYFFFSVKISKLEKQMKPY